MNECPGCGARRNFAVFFKSGARWLRCSYCGSETKEQNTGAVRVGSITNVNGGAVNICGGNLVINK